MGVTNQQVSKMVLKSQPQKVLVPVCENQLTLAGILSTTEHANSVGIRGVHSPRLNTLSNR